MKLYIVVHENASGPKDSVDTKLYLTEDAAEEGIYQEWTALMTEMGILDDYFSFDGLRNDCKSMKKITWNGKVIHRWEIIEQNLDIKAIIKVKGGMVQSVIANADVSVEVYDLDVSSYPEDGEEDEADQKARKFEELLARPDWWCVW